MTVMQFADLMEVKRDTVYKWIESDKLPKGAKLKEIAGKKFIKASAELIGSKTKETI